MKPNIKKKIIIDLGIPIICFLCGGLIGAVVVILWRLFTNINFARQTAYDPWQIVYYVFSILGAIATSFAVIVALFKEKFMQWFYKPAISINLIDQGVTENVDLTVPDPKASSYWGFIEIENLGNCVAKACKVRLCDISHGKKENNAKPINPISTKNLWWTASEVDLPINSPSKVRLFEIVDVNKTGTPEERSTNSGAKPRIKFNGCELKDHHTIKGFWKITYMLLYNNGDSVIFEVTVDWGGEFKSRETEMIDVLTVKLSQK